VAYLRPEYLKNGHESSRTLGGLKRLPNHVSIIIRAIITVKNFKKYKEKRIIPFFLLL